MSDTEAGLRIGIAMSESARPLPQTTMQLAGHATGALVEGLTAPQKAPWMLGVILLNLAGIVAAVYFLNVMIQGQQEHLKALLQIQLTQRQELLNLQQSERQELLVMHKWEFDQLLALANASTTPAPATASTPTSPGSSGRRPQ